MENIYTREDPTLLCIRFHHPEYRLLVVGKSSSQLIQWTKWFYSLGLWKTRLTEDTEDDRELYVKTTLRELAIYVGFITILCIREYCKFI